MSIHGDHAQSMLHEKVQGECAIGRPFVVDGKAILAPLRTGGASWNLSHPHQLEGADRARLVAAITALDRADREAIADVWARDALTEHASVAAFAKFILELVSLSAPAALVEGAQRALGDEIRHAERAFTLASLYAGAPCEPGALETQDVRLGVPDLATFAARTAAEGCIAETIAGLQLHAAADVARDPILAEWLRVTADDESEHALLAYRVVDWAIAKGGEPVRQAVAAVFADAASHVGFGPCPNEDASKNVLHAHGILPRADRHRLAVHVLDAVIAPAGALLVARRVAAVASA